MSSRIVAAMLFLLIPSFHLVLLRTASETTTKMSSCPRRCSCDLLPLANNIDELYGSDFIKVDCAGRRITADTESLEFYGADDFANVTVDLDLSRNAFNQLPLASLWSSKSSSAKFDNLREVDLSSNDLQIVTSGSLSEFVGTITGPRTLSLADNEIAQLGARCFAGLEELRHLTLSGNRLTRIEPASFIGLSRVERFELDRNQLESLPPQAFACLRSLRNVSLSHNKISSVGRDIFSRFAATRVNSVDSDGKLSTTTVMSNSVRYLLVDAGQKATATVSTECGVDNEGSASIIQFIDLSYNRLRSVPDWGTVGETLVAVALDGNPIRRLARWSFRSMPRLVNVSLSSMPDLVAVDRSAFVDLPQLERLQLHDNRRLGFIDPEAFDFRSAASMLFVSLNGNALQTVPDSLLSRNSISRRNSTAITTAMSIGGNPFHCDCNVRWICAILASSSPETIHANIGVPLITDGEDVRCDSPITVSGTLLAELKPGIVSTDRCPPVIIPFFDAVIHVVVDSESVISLDCRAIGIPQPRIHWILPNGRVINASTSTSTSASRRERVNVDPTGTLTIAGFRIPDRGTYTCVAMNERGYDAAATTLRPVTSSSNMTSSFDQSQNSSSSLSSSCDWPSTGPRLFVKSVSSTFIAVSWSGADALQSIVTPPALGGVAAGRPFGYSIVYREFDSVAGGGRRSAVNQQHPQSSAAADKSDTFTAKDDDDDRQYITRVPLRPSMRAFTVTNLRPLTTYEFCISCESSSTVTVTPSPSGTDFHILPASPLTVGRRRQHQQQQQQQQQQMQSTASPHTDSCIRVRTADRRISAVVPNVDGGDDAGYEFKVSRESDDATATGVIRTVFGATVMSSVAAVLSLCGLLVCVRRMRTRYRRHTYSDPTGGRRDSGGHHRDERLRKLCSDNGHDDTVARRSIGGNGRGFVGGRVNLIPMSDLGELPSTNLTSSRTSLLHAV